VVRWPRETDSPFGFGERVAMAFENWMSCQKSGLALLGSSRVSGATEARKPANFNECNEGKTTPKNEGLTPKLTGAHKACPKHAVYQRPR
jgi:hypothetical protein